MLQHRDPDIEYCAYCDAPASGPCATCGVMICADCARISGGVAKRVAVCVACEEVGAGEVGGRTMWHALKVPLGVLLAVLVLGLLLTWSLQ